MKALVKVALGDENLELRDVAEPQAKPDEVKVEIKAAGICGSDLHLLHGKFPCSPPVIIGHELSGQVVEQGSATTKFKPGDRVTAETIVWTCGQCKMCITDHHFLCPRRSAVGYQVNGAFAEYMSIREDLLHKIPANLSYQEGSLFEPLVCSVHCAVERAKIKSNDKILISGPGSIGLLILQVVKSKGAFVIMAGVSGDEPRLKLAKELGADVTIAQPSDDLVYETMRITAGEGVDKAIEASGAPSSFETCSRLIARKGSLIQVGIFGKKFPIDFDNIIQKELNIVTSMSQTRTAWEKALEMARSGNIRIKPLITHIFSLKEWEKAFKVAEGREGIKVLFDPTR